MTTTPALSDAVTGMTRLADREVHWRLGWADPGADPSVIARVWLAELATAHGLFEWAGIGPARPWTKPRLAGDPDADASISHSGRAVLVAVMRGRGLGADIEVAPYRAFAAPTLLSRMCTPAERKALMAQPPGERRFHAAALWTAKEALVKATGRGLAHDPRTVHVEPAPAPAGAVATAHLAVADGARTALAALDVAGLSRSRPEESP
ncbi:4'-phosphopantetheinyl transferase family protein [Microbacterium sediminis]|uniref:Uncharacterized protein n=1 Tax=Microbacterium sediminis TaxID=904291 RepID=A0A1B9NGQ4_9MICO|nr:4'-phosphopantetheinyl transferase superfamily protein [Microbacterium sediminis]OCG75778.1 hypothetical protein A7J15_01655 [Microbacterium sediminis]QBR74170.1 4'-phosphopantetheinyl transferase superfamily protein [Microbacterium sediminis]